VWPLLVAGVDQLCSDNYDMQESNVELLRPRDSMNTEYSERGGIKYL
jgi:hypothetical protein